MIIYVLFFIAFVILTRFVRLLYRAWGPSKLNKYDSDGEIASLSDDCRFCEIIQNTKDFIFEDRFVIAIHDIDPHGKTHLLIIPKRHIKDLNWLRKSDTELLIHMKKVAEELKNEHCPSNPAKIGYHRPVFTSIKHLHLHLISLPFTKTFMGNLFFNKGFFITAEESISKIKSS